MTRQNLRDIAAYWGATCSFERLISMDSMEYNGFRYEGLIPWNQKGSIWLPFKEQISAETLKYAQETEDSVRAFKLHLRPLSALTDDEVRECARRYGATFVSNHPVNRYDNYVEIADASFALDYTDGIDVNGGGWSPLSEFAAMIGYLQSIGVYVPGMISEQYVMLVQSPVSLLHHAQR